MTEFKDKSLFPVYDGQNWPIYKYKIQAYADSKDMLGILKGTLTLQKFEEAEEQSQDQFLVRQLKSVKVSKETSKSEDENEKDEKDVQQKIDNVDSDDEEIAIEGFTKSGFIKANKHLFHIITGTIKDLNGFLDIAIGNTLGIWNRLLSMHESQSQASIKQMLATLIEIKQNGKPVNEFVSDVTVLANRLKASVKEQKVDILDVLTKMQLINGLDSKYDTFKEHMFLEESYTVDKCKAKIIETVERLNINHKYEKPSGSIAMQVGEKSSDMICNYCHKKGHIEKNCFLKFPELNKKSNNNSKPNNRNNSNHNNRNKSNSNNNNHDNNDQNNKNKKAQKASSKDGLTFSSQAWMAKTLGQAKAVASEPGAIIFDIDSAADKTFKCKDGEGLDDFDPTASIDIELADTSVTKTQGKGTNCTKFMWHLVSEQICCLVINCFKMEKLLYFIQHMVL